MKHSQEKVRETMSDEPAWAEEKFNLGLESHTALGCIYAHL